MHYFIILRTDLYPWRFLEKLDFYWVSIYPASPANQPHLA